MTRANDHSLFFKHNSPLFYRFVQVSLILLLGFLVAFTFVTVPLTPHVDQTFFFSDDDPQLEQDRKINKIFRQQDQIIINVEGQISSPKYLAKIESLTDRLLKIPEVLTAKSLTHGPKDFQDAITSEFWGRALIPDDRRSSNIFVILAGGSSHRAIPKIESAVSESETESFRPIVAGIPYIIELIQRRLLYDVKVFSLCAVGLFGVMIFFIFRSISILVGCLSTSIAATSLTLLIGHSAGIEMGILTANLVALVFVLTIPHTIYFTYNWKRSRDGSTAAGGIRRAFRETLPGSVWSTTTTLLGFLSLFLVEAKPLRQLGASGSIGTLCALSVAYMVYPVFLLGVDQQNVAGGIDGTEKSRRSIFSRLSSHSRWIAGAFVVACLLLGTGVFRLDTDPSLLSYFPSSLRRGLEQVDQSGGSSLLEIVLRDSRSRTLASNEAYERLWQLQRTLERDPEVGTIVSLPMLMAEGKDFPFSFLFRGKRF